MHHSYPLSARILSICIINKKLSKWHQGDGKVRYAIQFTSSSAKQSLYYILPWTLIAFFFLCLTSVSIMMGIDRAMLMYKSTVCPEWQQGWSYIPVCRIEDFWLERPCVL